MEYSNYLDTIDCSEFKKVVDIQRIVERDKETIKSFVEGLIKAMVIPNHDYEGEEYKSYRAVGFISNGDKKNKLLELNYYPDTNTIHSTEFSIYLDGENRSLSYNNSSNDIQYVYYNKDEFILMNYTFLYENNFFQISNRHYDRNITFNIESMKHVIVDIHNSAEYGKKPILENKYIMKNADLNFNFDLDTISVSTPEKYAYRTHKDLFSTFKNIFFKNNKVNEIQINQEELKSFFKNINQNHEIDFSDIKVNDIVDVKEYNNFINDIKEKLELYSLLDDIKVDISLLTINDIEDAYKEIKLYQSLQENIFSLVEPIESTLYQINSKTFMNGMFVSNYAIENLPDIKYPKIGTDTIYTIIETINIKQTLNEINDFTINNVFTTDKELKIKNKMEL